MIRWTADIKHMDMLVIRQYIYLGWFLQRIRSTRFLGHFRDNDPDTMSSIPQYLIQFSATSARNPSSSWAKDTEGVVVVIVSGRGEEGRGLEGKKIVTLNASSSVRSSPMYIGKTSSEFANPRDFNRNSTAFPLSHLMAGRISITYFINLTELINQI